MENCKGLKNWFECLRCVHICSSQCPLEGADVLDRLVLQLRRTEAAKEDTETH